LGDSYRLSPKKRRTVFLQAIGIVGGAGMTKIPPTQADREFAADALVDVRMYRRDEVIEVVAELIAWERERYAQAIEKVATWVEPDSYLAQVDMGNRCANTVREGARESDWTAADAAGANDGGGPP
jgi:hypothetical protein